MDIIKTAIDGVLIIEPKVFGDSRGYFFESFNAREFAEKTGMNISFVQDNESMSSYGVMRGLHFQRRHIAGICQLIIADDPIIRMLLEHVINEIRANKTSTAGNQYPHCIICISFQLLKKEYQSLPDKHVLCLFLKVMPCLSEYASQCPMNCREY